MTSSVDRDCTAPAGFMTATAGSNLAGRLRAVYGNCDRYVAEIQIVPRIAVQFAVQFGGECIFSMQYNLECKAVPAKPQKMSSVAICTDTLKMVLRWYIFSSKHVKLNAWRCGLGRGLRQWNLWPQQHRARGHLQCSRVRAKCEHFNLHVMKKNNANRFDVYVMIL